jgi:hypothetical protein
MISNFKILVLAAGRGIGLDGFNKLNLVCPSSRETVLERYMRQLSKDVSIVVGYRAPEIISKYPNLNYAYNYKWYETGSAFSASLGLHQTPIIVLPSDLFLSEMAAETIRNATGDVIFTSATENRPTNAVNVVVNKRKVVGIYEGPKRQGADQEFKGIVRIETDECMSALRSTCECNPALALSDCLGLHAAKFQAIDIGGAVSEINSVEDYMDYFLNGR